MAADCQWPSGLGPDQSVFTSRSMSNARPRRSSSICAPCSTNTVYARPSFVTMGNSRSRARASSQFPPQQRHLPASARDAWRDRSRRRGRGSPSALAFAPEAKGFALTASTTTWRCSRCSRSIVGLASNTIAAIRGASWAVYVRSGKHHEIVEILTCYGDHFDVMTAATGISWRREGPGTGARTPLIYLLMAVSARRLSTATVGEVNVHWRSVAKWM